MSSTPRQRVAVVMTVKNDAHACAVTLQSLLSQTRAPDEIVVVDGGSSDHTRETVAEYARKCGQIRLIEAAGANIAAGRNLAIRAAAADVIATIDAGCRAESDWLDRLTAPFEQDGPAEFVGGFYKIEPQSLLEAVGGLATMRGQLDPVDPWTFNPSARSMAFTKRAWERAGGFPQWLRFSEDTLFDHRMRSLGFQPLFVEAAVVHWRPRTSLRSIARQFYNYGTGRGHTQIGASDFLYNLRNALIVAGLSIACFWHAAAYAALAAAVVYFYFWSFHHKAVRIVRRIGRIAAYPVCLLVMWIVLFANTLGYIVGTWQRTFAPTEYRDPMAGYLPPVTAS